MPKIKLLPPIMPSLTLKVEYERALKELLSDMYFDSRELLAKQIVKALEERREYIADASPLDKLQQIINKLRTKYEKKYGTLSRKFPSDITKKIETDVSRRLRNQLAKEMSVKFHFNPALEEVLRAAAKENVSLIKSIPERYFRRLEYDVMSTVRNGENKTKLYEKLQDNYHTTRNRAYLIADDQINKITEQVERTRKQELGLYKAIWRHSGIPKEPRQSHKLADGKVYDIRKGCKIDREYIHPKEKINCNCFSQTVISKST